jgi:hypothetical protein
MKIRSPLAGDSSAATTPSASVETTDLKRLL